MTLPTERTRSLAHARNFLLDLLRPDITPRVPKEIRTRARSVLKHFPTRFEVYQIAKWTYLLDQNEAEKEMER